jgi:hypothetical protein
MRRRLAIVWKHSLGKEAIFSGGFHIHGDRIAVRYTDGGVAKVRCLTRTGEVAWERSWPDLGTFHLGSGDALFTGGQRIRRLSMDDGSVLAEQPVDGTFDPIRVFDTGPVYSNLKRIQGRDGRTLELLWELPDGGKVMFHQNRLCRITDTELITMRPPNLAPTQVTLERPISPPGNNYHTHYGNLWCHFSLTTGGRTAVDESTGRVVWSFAEPDGYGISAFDESSAYSTFGPVAAYDLRTGAQRWRRDMDIDTVAYVSGGKLYGGAPDGSSPVVFIIDGSTGELLLEGTFDYKLGQMGAEPRPVMPFGEKLLIVGTRKAVIAVSTE